MGLRTIVLEAGFTQQQARFAERDKSWGTKHKFPATAVLMEHPKSGYVLFDTAYSPHFYEAASRFPEAIYAKVTPVCIDWESTIAAQLKKIGISETEVSMVILSHFHADHIGGARLFSKAKYIYSKSSYDAVKDRSRWKATLAGFLPALLPSDFVARSIYTESLPSTQTFFGAGADLFNDGSLVLVPLPGHATGQMGALVESNHGPLLLAADAVWSHRAYQEGVYPHWLAHLILQNFDSKVYHDTIEKISSFHKSHPDIKIVPCHCGISHELGIW